MDLLSRVGSAGLNLSMSLTDQAHRVAALSSGLRIRSAADDPSGLAIAESLSSRVAGLQYGRENIQNAINLLTVAQSSIQSIGEMLQRVRSLVVEAASDLESPRQLDAIQTEIDALKTEINQVAAKAQFNGAHLLDGSLDNRMHVNAFVQEVAAPPVNGASPSRTVVNADGAGNPGLLIQNATVGNGVEAATISISVTGYDPNAVDPIIGPIGGPGLYVQVTAYSMDPSFGAGQQLTSVTAVPENAGPQAAVLSTPSGSNSFFQFTIANLTSADVGAAQTFVTYHDLAPAGGTPLSIQGGGGEGSVLQLSVPKLSTETLGISAISVAAPATVDDFNNPQGPANSNATAALDAETRTDAAIQMVSSLQAQVGAQTVALQGETGNAEIQAAATAAAQSAIIDANIGSEATAYAKDAALTQIAQSAILSEQDSARAFAQAMSDNIAGPPPKSQPEPPPLTPPASGKSGNAEPA